MPPSKFDPRLKGREAAAKKRELEAAKQKAAISQWMQANNVSFGARGKGSKPTGSVPASMLGVSNKNAVGKTTLFSNGLGGAVKRGTSKAEWERATEAATGLSKNNSAAANAAILAASVVPIPGLKGLGTVAKTAGKVTKAGGKTATSIAKDTAKAASRRTPKESATIAKGTAKSRTKEGAAALERAEARSASRKSVMDGPKASVTARAGKEAGELPKGADERISGFGKRRSESFKNEAGKGGRTAAQQKRAKADLEESLRRGRRMREEGVNPKTYGDYPADSIPSTVRDAPATARASVREAAATARSTALTKPKNPGRNGTANQQAKYKQEMAAWEKQQAKTASKEKDISEGRRSTETGELRGPSAKSARRQQEKLTKSKAKREDAPAVKKPSVKKVETPKADAPKAKVTPSTPAAKPASVSAADRAAEIKAAVKKPSATGGSGGKGGGSGKGTGGSGSGAGKPSGSPKPSADRAADIRDAAKATGLKVKTPNSPNPNKYSPAFSPNKSKANTPITGSARAEEIRKAALAGKAVKESDAAAASKAGLGFNKKQKAVIAGAGVAGGAAAFQNKLDRDAQSDKSKDEAKPVSNKTASETVRDKFGRKISRAEFDRREAFRKANNLDSLSPAERAKWRKENKDKWQAEESRRGKYRKNLGRKAFGKEAVAKTRNVKKRKSFDLDAKKSLKG